MVEKYIGKHWCTRYYRETKSVDVYHKDKLVMSQCFSKLYQAVNFYASLKTVAEVKDLIEEIARKPN